MKDYTQNSDFLQNRNSDFLDAVQEKNMQVQYENAVQDAIERALYEMPMYQGGGEGGGDDTESEFKVGQKIEGIGTISNIRGENIYFLPSDNFLYYPDSFITDNGAEKLGAQSFLTTEQLNFFVKNGYLPSYMDGYVNEKDFIFVNKDKKQDYLKKFYNERYSGFRTGQHYWIQDDTDTGNNARKVRINHLTKDGGVQVSEVDDTYTFPSSMFSTSLTGNATYDLSDTKRKWIPAKGNKSGMSGYEESLKAQFPSNEQETKINKEQVIDDTKDKEETETKDDTPPPPPVVPITTKTTPSVKTTGSFGFYSNGLGEPIKRQAGKNQLGGYSTYADAIRDDIRNRQGYNIGSMLRENLDFYNPYSVEFYSTKARNQDGTKQKSDWTMDYSQAQEDYKTLQKDNPTADMISRGFRINDIVDPAYKVSNIYDYLTNDVFGKERNVLLNSVGPVLGPEVGNFEINSRLMNDRKQDATNWYNIYE